MLAGWVRWHDLDVVEVLNVAEALIVEEIRHAAVLGVESSPLPEVDLSIPLATRHGFASLPHASARELDEEWLADTWEPPPGVEAGAW